MSLSSDETNLLIGVTPLYIMVKNWKESRSSSIEKWIETQRSTTQPKKEQTNDTQTTNESQLH